jgi:hypothetical protein
LLGRRFFFGLFWVFIFWVIVLFGIVLLLGGLLLLFFFILFPFLHALLDLLLLHLWFFKRLAPPSVSKSQLSGFFNVLFDNFCSTVEGGNGASGFVNCDVGAVAVNGEIGAD